MEPRPSVTGTKTEAFLPAGESPTDNKGSFAGPVAELARTVNPNEDTTNERTMSENLTERTVRSLVTFAP
jgi:hypothetical protein